MNIFTKNLSRAAGVLAVSAIILSLFATSGVSALTASGPYVSCDAQVGCSFPNRTESSCGQEVCAVTNTDPILVAPTPVDIIRQCQQAVAPAGCYYVGGTDRGCDRKLICAVTNKDPIMVTTPAAKLTLIESIKKQLAVLQQLLSALLSLRALGVHVD
jgi:hypothetical protein